MNQNLESKTIKLVDWEDTKSSPITANLTEVQTRFDADKWFNVEPLNVDLTASDEILNKLSQTIDNDF